MAHNAGFVEVGMLAAWIRALFLGLLATSALAHAPDREGIARHTAALRENPDDVDHLVGRADLLRHAGRLQESERDYWRALDLDPERGAATLGWAEVIWREGRATAAEAALDSFLNEHEEAIAGWRLMARLQESAGDPRRAAEAWDRVLRLAPTPADFLARADHAVAAREPRHALAVLTDGIARLDGATALRWRAVDVAQELGDVDMALAHLAALEIQMARPEVVVARRGDVLLAAGRRLEACAEWTRALEALEAGPSRVRTRASVELEERLRASLRGGSEQ